MVSHWGREAIRCNTWTLLDVVFQISLNCSWAEGLVNLFIKFSIKIFYLFGFILTPLCRGWSWHEPLLCIFIDSWHCCHRSVTMHAPLLCLYLRKAHEIKLFYFLESGPVKCNKVVSTFVDTGLRCILQHRSTQIRTSAHSKHDIADNSNSHWLWQRLWF